MKEGVKSDSVTFCWEKKKKHNETTAKNLSMAAVLL